MVFERVDIEILQIRADLTGGNDDETFANRKYMEGNPSDPKDFNIQVCNKQECIMLVK